MSVFLLYTFTLIPSTCLMSINIYFKTKSLLPPGLSGEPSISQDEWQTLCIHTLSKLTKALLSPHAQVLGMRWTATGQWMPTPWALIAHTVWAIPSNLLASATVLGPVLSTHWWSAASLQAFKTRPNAQAGQMYKQIKYTSTSQIHRQYRQAQKA